MKRIKRITAWFLCILMLGSVPICAVEQPVGGETSLGCSECGQVEGHYATCNLYTCSVCGALLNQMGWVHNEGCANTPAQSVGQDMTADYSGSVGMLAAFHAFSETNPNGFPYFSVKADPKLEDQDEVNLRVISVEDEDFQADLSMIVLDWYVDSQNGLWYKVTAADGHTMPDILTQFPWVFQDYLDESSAGNSLILTKPGSQEEPETEETLTDESMGVKVSGKFLEGTTLSVKSATLADVAKIDTMLSGIPEAHKVVDISLVKDGAEYQPNEKVAVTMNVSDVEPVGKDVLVYHVHEESAGTVTTEVLGPFQVNADGNITFTMDNFSYVIVFTADYSISGIEAFYPGALEGSDSTNDQLTFLGVYYDAQNIAHFLLAFAANSNAANAEAKFEHVTIDTHTYYKQDVTYKITDTKFANLTLKDETGNIVYTSPASNKKGYGGIFDITLGLAKIRDGFFVGVNNQNTGNGWRIGGNLVLDLDYELIKTVAVGTSALGAFEESVVIERGDWVIFRLNVNNKGGRPLTDMLVQDILPDGVFDMSTVQMSIDGEDGEIGNWEPFSSTLFADYSSAGGFSRKLYIKAQVNPNLAITSDTTYTNKATIDGMNMPTYEDTANIIVRAPGTGTLTVSKAVTSENPNDSAPDTEFSFTIQSEAGQAGLFSYRKSDGTTGSVENSGIFSLKNGESIGFENFPVGRFTVTELGVAGFSTKVNGNAGITYSGEMTALASPVVAFENQFSTRLASLTIEKQVDKEYEKDRVPDHVFTFKVVIGDGSDTTTQYPYMLGEISGHIISGGIIQLKNGQVAVIENIPVGTNYTVTEVLEGVSDDYKTAVNGKEGFTTNGVLSADGERAVFLNTYLKHFADLTITKSGAEAIDENQSFLFTLSGEGITLDVIVRGNGSVTIKDLPIGTYTVTENTDWSWRYTPENNVKQKTITLTADGNNGVKFSNYRSVIHWLSGDSFRENQFNKTQSVRTGGKEAV